MSDSDVSVVTGAASGIGRHLCGALLRSGRRVVATDVNQEALDAAVAAEAWPSDALRVARLDVTVPQDWDTVMVATLDAWGRLDQLMNVAGYLQPGYVHESEAQEIDRHLDVNLKGVILGTRAAAKIMVAQGYGHIVNIGSLASLAPAPGLSLYVASKFGVRGFSLAAAQELKAHNVYLSLVMPDAVQTPMLDKQLPHDEAALTFSGQRALSVDEITHAIVGQVLARKPLELMLPSSRGRLAKLVNMVPRAARVLEPMMRRRGLREQARRRGEV